MKNTNLKYAILALTINCLILVQASPHQAQAQVTVQKVGQNYLALYPVNSQRTNTRAVSFMHTGSRLEMYDDRGQLVWSNTSVTPQYFGGFDLNTDGWVDIGSIYKQQIQGRTCGTHAIFNTEIRFVDGQTGADLPRFISPLEDKCWTFPSSTYPTAQWSELSILFGSVPGLVALQPYYATQGFLGTWLQTSLNFGAYYIYPSTASYDSSYLNDKPYGGRARGPSFLSNSHTANGLIITDESQKQRLVFFTSGRVVQYEFGPFHSRQLIADAPFLSGGRQDMAGRNYGLVSIDPHYPAHIALISGTNNYSLYADMLANQMKYDTWGQIERHVTLYNYKTNQVRDRFYSYAHDSNDGAKYSGRVTYPNNPWVTVAPGRPSRLAYNVYEGGRWNLHISEPGSLTDRYALRDIYLWDIVDIDGDGVDEWVTSPTRDPQDRDVPGYYFAKWRTSIYNWQESNLTLISKKTFEGIPELTMKFREPKKTTSMSYLYPVSILRDADLNNKIVLRQASGQLTEQQY